MPVNRRSIAEVKTFNLPLNYNTDAEELSFRDTRNVFFNNGKLETRFGFSRFNDTTLGGSVLSTSFFKDTSGNFYLLAKVGTVLYRVNASGAATSIKTGLTSTTKHRGLTLNNRHIISIEQDGLFQYNGSTFTQLGQTAPTAPTIADGSSGSVTSSTYSVGITFYDSTNGFESNQGNSSNVAIASGEINVTNIPSTADNANIDKVRIYLKDITNNSNYLFIAEISLGTTTYDITADSSSTQTPPTTHAAPTSGGGRYLTEFNTKLVYCGNNTFKNDVFFSETDLPDAFDDTSSALKLFISGQGEITGIATGFYNNSNLDPYLVITKKNSTHIYSELGGNGRLVTISMTEGCPAHNTMSVYNGDVYFISENGFKVISNGNFVSSKGKTVNLGGNRIDDIFKTPGYIYELNKSQSSNFFATYYPTLDQYICWVAEGSNTSFDKQYVWEHQNQRWAPYQFYIPATSSCLGEDSNGDVVYFSDSDGWIYQHSINEARNDIDSSNSSQTIDAFAILYWANFNDYDASYSFRELIVRAITGNDITVRTWINSDISLEGLLTYEFTDPISGFVLDVSKLDEAVFSDGRTVVRSRGDINRTGYNISIGFYQNVASANINLISAQLHYNKNGNPNTN